jgi:hypothetical protein
MGRLVRKKVIKAKPGLEIASSAHHLGNFSWPNFVAIKPQVFTFVKEKTGKNEKADPKGAGIWNFYGIRILILLKGQESRGRVKTFFSYP